MLPCPQTVWRAPEAGGYINPVFKNCFVGNHDNAFSIGNLHGVPRVDSCFKCFESKGLRASLQPLICVYNNINIRIYIYIVCIYNMYAILCYCMFMFNGTGVSTGCFSASQQVHSRKATENSASCWQSLAGCKGQLQTITSVIRVQREAEKDQKTDRQ